jgi:hypothetical protein
MLARLFAILVLMFLLLGVPLNGWSIPLTEPDLDGRQGQAGDCEKEIEDYLEGLRPVIVDCLEDATVVDEAKKCADLLI